MGIQKLVAIVLILIGVIGLAYGGFTYTKDVHNADVGPLHMSFSEKEHVNIPIWAGLAFVLVGGVLLVTRKKL
jgi:TRAP-type C4-dicarboxylate transport system permease small subunit